LKKTVSIIGGGSCALILGCELNTEKYDVTIFERNSAPARKFLVAGDGGLNLTHSEEPDKFIQRYTPSDFLKPAFFHFSNQDLVRWLNAAGIETYTGTSGRIFPKKGIKPASVLKTITEIVKKNSVRLLTGHEWKGFQGDKLVFESGGEEIQIGSDIVIFCLGGASWPVTGSKGDWLSFFSAKQISVTPFRASNCSFELSWPENFSNSHAGKVLKNCTITCEDKTNMGEVVITKKGLEGSGIYPLSPQIRKQLTDSGTAEVFIDLKPQVTTGKIKERISAALKKKNITEAIRSELNFDATTLQLLKNFTSKEEFNDPDSLAKNIKSLRLKIKGTGPVEDAISTVGGISLDEINGEFELKKMPRHYAIGEMLDYDAPTGGYLLQSCFSMAHYLAGELNKK
jgi:uncharacterized flavoprotein (TIGR03862 family)